MERWAGRVALVTGASSGVGKALAIKLVKNGLKVVGCARNIEKIRKLAADLKDEKGSLVAIKCDISKEDEVLSMFSRIKAEQGGVDICVNNAALNHISPLLSGTTEDWKHMLEVNVLGPSICTREAVKSMKERHVDDGHVIHVNSLSGHRILSDPGTHFYSATKYALTALTEGLRNELRAMKSHIRVSAISPGLIHTEFTLRMTNYDEEASRKRHSAFVNLQADDIVDGIIYALSAPPHVQVHDILVRPTEQPL